jgi:aspartyl/asparaginyl beta-hydroxylase (cupin superfamily)
LKIAQKVVQIEKCLNFKHFKFEIAQVCKNVDIIKKFKKKFVEILKCLNLKNIKINKVPK